MIIQEIEKLQKEFQKKAEKFFEEYQETGMNGKYKSYEKYDDLTNICELAIQQLNNNEGRSTRRFNNYSDYLAKLVDKQYSLKEVKEIVWNTLNF
jgi:CRISPR/Cas system-associated endonuclease Cas3-HD